MKSQIKNERIKCRESTLCSWSYSKLLAVEDDIELSPHILLTHLASYLPDPTNTTTFRIALHSSESIILYLPSTSSFNSAFYLLTVTLTIKLPSLIAEPFQVGLVSLSNAPAPPSFPFAFFTTFVVLCTVCISWAMCFFGSLLMRISNLDY